MMQYTIKDIAELEKVSQKIVRKEIENKNFKSIKKNKYIIFRI